MVAMNTAGSRWYKVDAVTAEDLNVGCSFADIGTRG